MKTALILAETVAFIFCVAIVQQHDEIMAEQDAQSPKAQLESMCKQKWPSEAEKVKLRVCHG